jgi:hypothetical protein
VPSTPATKNDPPTKETKESFNQPATFARALNKLFGFFVGLGFSLPHNYLLQVRGRKSGRVYATPVDVLNTSGQAIFGSAARAHAMGT